MSERSKFCVGTQNEDWERVLLKPGGIFLFEAQPYFANYDNCTRST